jgi:signal transduction histidine kinase
VPVVSRSGATLGGLALGHSREDAFTPRSRRLATGIASQTAVALDNARLYREAQEALHARDQFLSIASHELRTPLAAIKATAQAALRASARGLLDRERAERSLRTIATSTDHVARLASDLLDVARLRAGSLPILRTRFELSELLDRVVESFNDQWDGQRELTLDTATADVVIDGDPDRLQQVFGNLLENAAKYSPAGSPIRLSSTVDAVGVQVAVADQGIGVPEASARTLFEPFGRAPNAIERQIQGLGLGLYVARQLVDAHHGRIWCTSAGDGLGAVFYVWLPRAQVDGSTAGASTNGRPV